MLVTEMFRAAFHWSFWIEQQILTLMILGTALLFTLLLSLTTFIASQSSVCGIPALCGYTGLTGDGLGFSWKHSVTNI